MWIKLALAVLNLGLLFAGHYYSAKAERKKKAEGLKDEVRKAIESGDISRVNSVIERLRH